MTRTRFAPSPTGFLHIGGLRTAAYAYALAKHDRGEFFLRIEDTDQKREVTGAAEDIYRILKIFNLSWDNEPMIQSARQTTGVYQQAAEKLLQSGQAFYCQCPPRNAKTEGFSTVLRDPCRDKHFSSGAVKLRVPDGEILTFHDFAINKDISWNSSDIADTILLKTDGFPTYHLAVAVDDAEMGITHVIRAVEWLPSTPIHILVHRHLGLTLPQIGHPTDILDPDGGKLSKRKRNVSCEQFIADGYLPEAIFNFVILLGWAPKDNRELFSLSEFVSAFDPRGFQKSNAMYSDAKLNWFNGHYLRSKTDTELTQLVKPFVKNTQEDTLITQIVPLIKDRLIKLSDFDSLTGFFFSLPEIDLQLFPDPTLSSTHLSSALSHLSACDWSKSGIETGWTDQIKAAGWKVGDFFMSLRIAICGSRFTPPLTDTMLILGQSESLARIKNALNLLKKFKN
jgi:glutamyl-tRNA synthetase